MRGLRTAEILKLQRSGNAKRLRQTKKNYAKTDAYIHLTYSDRWGVIKKVADTVANWGKARLFAECIDKVHFDPVWAGKTAEEQAFEQVISRFQQFLTSAGPGGDSLGMIVHDNNESVAMKHTELMRKYYETGTLWTSVDKIVETPLFVDSSLTRMVQVADLCAYAIRRYLENDEVDLFRRIFARADRLSSGKTVGVRHFTSNGCVCEVCSTH
ncbi:hypothetical protein DEA8626_00349 [Defluviimonas aquaemixtae]|uniref:DUF3800 domain-containing protein n=1 Tax=Albidovulum aquaemixtae TaxID=1542388 RepID=A0A2R8B2N2_9RHOB|nr:hypothetical protein DEA8626_00349 [Defluviimonas aquaemixtae]